MHCKFLTPLLIGCVSGALTGCGHMVESRVIQAFTDSLEKEDLKKLRSTASDDFEQKTVQVGSDPLRAFKMLDIPEGKTKVVKVKDDDGAKQVTAVVGPEKRKVMFRLERDAKTKKWVVADLFLKDTNSAKSVGDQVSLLVSLREFLDAWKDGTRHGVLATSTPELGQILGELSDEHLAHLTRQIAAEIAEQDNIEPAAQIHQEEAGVVISRLNGKLVVTFKTVDGRWKVSEAAVESQHEGEAIPSVRERAIATTRTLAFQAAYNASDKHALEQICTRRFFEGSLAGADLALARLPNPAPDDENFDLKMDGSGAHCVVQTDQEIVKISLVRDPPDDDKPHAPSDYHVDEVTIYERHGNQDKRLSALFTAHARMQVFSEALVHRDLTTLRLNSTHDLNKRVWERLTAATLRQMPLAEIHPGAIAILNTDFQGPLTEVTVNQGPGPLTYVLREQSGKMLVDDVLLPVAERPESLKSTCDMMIPILDFAAGFRLLALDLVRANASREFSRMVWDLVERIPPLDQPPALFLAAPLSKISVTGDRALVVLGDDRHGARVLLAREKDRYTIENVILVSGPAAQERVDLRQVMRGQLAEGTVVNPIAAAPETAPETEQASAAP